MQGRVDGRGGFDVPFVGVGGRVAPLVGVGGRVGPLVGVGGRVAPLVGVVLCTAFTGVFFLSTLKLGKIML